MSTTAVEQPKPEHAAAPPSETFLYTLLSAMVFFWALNFIAGKLALRAFPPLLLAGLRAALAGAMIWPVYLWDRKRNPGRVQWRRSDMPKLMGLGLCGVGLNQVFFVMGLSRTSVAHASILLATTPIMVLVIAALWRLERITAGKALGMGIALAGVAVLDHSSGGSGASLVGDCLILLGALAFALFTVFGKRFAGRFGSITVSTFAYTGGALMLLPVTIWQSAGFAYGRVDAGAWASLAYMAALPSVVCYLIFYYALTYLPASRVSAFSYFQPLLATLLAVPLLGEPVTAQLMLGGAMVFAGVCVAERA